MLEAHRNFHQMNMHLVGEEVYREGRPTYVCERTSLDINGIVNGVAGFLGSQGPEHEGICCRDWY